MKRHVRGRWRFQPISRKGNSILEKEKQGGNQQNLFQELHETNVTDKQRASEKLKIKEA